jgi:hypothetical protein
MMVSGVNDGLAIVDRLGEGIMEEGVLDVQLVHKPAPGDGQCQHNADGGRLHDEVKSLIVVHTKGLGLLEEAKGKEDSSKTTCQETNRWFMERSRHRYPLMLRGVAKEETLIGAKSKLMGSGGKEVGVVNAPKDRRKRELCRRGQGGPGGATSMSKSSMRNSP